MKNIPLIWTRDGLEVDGTNARMKLLVPGRSRKPEPAKTSTEELPVEAWRKFGT
jgi:hypothetical protein